MICTSGRDSSVIGRVPGPGFGEPLSFRGPDKVSMGVATAHVSKAASMGPMMYLNRARIPRVTALTGVTW